MGLKIFSCKVTFIMFHAEIRATKLVLKDVQPYCEAADTDGQ
jgi:hypothetical protein